MAWKTGGREDILRRRPPDFCKLVLVVCILTLTLLAEYANGISCKLDEVQQRTSSGGYHCVKCPVCPPGQGLHNPQCLNFLKLNIKESLKCVPCRTGTFSNKNDTASCQACQQCDGHKTLRNCTKTENSVCSTECKDGFKLEEVFGIQMCVPYTKKPRTTSRKPKTHLYTTGELTPTPPKSTQKSTMGIKDDDETKTPSINNRGQEGEKQKPNVFTITISICLLICFTFIFVFGIKKRKRIWKFICSCKRGSDQTVDETTPMSPVTPNLACQHLKDVSHTLMGKIASEISKRGLKGWREIGEIYKISKIELDEMETRSLWSGGNRIPGELVLEFLVSSKPELNLKEFIEMLGSLKRDDVIRLIHKECHITE